VPAVEKDSLGVIRPLDRFVALSPMLCRIESKVWVQKACQYVENKQEGKRSMGLIVT
jgi:hypothetical protein